MATGSDEAIERLSRYLFNAPAWRLSLVLVILLGLVLDSIAMFVAGFSLPAGTLLLTIPAIAAMLLTHPAIRLAGAPFTWNRSALLAGACAIGVFLVLLPVLLIAPGTLPWFYAGALGFISGLRLVILVAVADYRLPRMIIPAVIQACGGLCTGMIMMGASFAAYALIVQVIFIAATSCLVWCIERPFRRNFHTRGLWFLNALLAHLTEGTRDLEGFFRAIGEEVTLPQATIVLVRDRMPSILVTVPNIHPGPLGDVGGGRLPMLLSDAYPDDHVLCAHGCATHDYNLVAEEEVGKVIDAVRRAASAAPLGDQASQSFRVSCGSVSILAQRIHTAYLLVSTRAPDRTEDVDLAIGLSIMAEGRALGGTIAFVDAHNVQFGTIAYVQAGSAVALEYQEAAREAFARYSRLPLESFKAGAAHQTVPFGREDGFGDQGIMALVIEVGTQRTGYVLFDGNNLAAGVRERVLDAIADLVHHAEVMTTDSHVVNTISGKNPVGMRVPPDDIVPYVRMAVEGAIGDLAPARGGGAVADCERVRVFGQHRIAELGATMNSLLVLLPPLTLLFLLVAVLLSLLVAGLGI